MSTLCRSYNDFAVLHPHKVRIIIIIIAFVADFQVYVATRSWGRNMTVRRDSNCAENNGPRSIV